MSIKQILVPLTGLGDPAHLLAAAFKLARRFKAHVVGCDVMEDPVPYVDPSGFGITPIGYEELVDTTTRIVQERREKVELAFARACAKAKVPLRAKGAAKGPSASWTSGKDFRGNPAITLGRLSDLIVMELPGGKEAVQDFSTLEELVFATGRPVLAVPAGTKNVLAGRAAIAWNGSLEASRAVTGALPLLTLGKGVDIIQVSKTDEPGDAGAGLLAQYLGRQGVKAKVRRVRTSGRAPGKVIASKASGAGLLVMGAYAHSPMREMVMGGVTNQILKTARVPLLLAH